MGTWTRLREDLLRLEASTPPVLQSYPDPRGPGTGAPYALQLTAFAEAVAAELHGKYGGAVALTVGALPYPPTEPGVQASQVRDPLPLPIAADLDVELDGPLSIRTGHDAGHHILVRNHGEAPLRLLTSGAVATVLVDPATERTVGGSTRPSLAVQVSFSLTPGEVTRVPVSVGTDSFDPELGYRVPAGDWSLVALLKIASGSTAVPGPERQMASRPLPFTITN